MIAPYRVPNVNIALKYSTIGPLLAMQLAFLNPLAPIRLLEGC